MGVCFAPVSRVDSILPLGFQIHDVYKGNPKPIIRLSGFSEWGIIVVVVDVIVVLVAAAVVVVVVVRLGVSESEFVDAWFYELSSVMVIFFIMNIT